MLGFCASFTCTRGGEQRETVAIAHMVLTRLVSSASMILLATFRSKGYAIDAPVERARSGAPATGHVEKGGVDDGSLSLYQGASGSRARMAWPRSCTASKMGHHTVRPSSPPAYPPELLLAAVGIGFHAQGETR